jgi:hypothetical protein
MQRLPSHKQLLLTVLQAVRTAAPRDAVRKIAESRLCLKTLKLTVLMRQTGVLPQKSLSGRRS